MKAAHQGHVDVMRFLLRPEGWFRRVTDVNHASRKTGWTALMTASKWPKNKDVNAEAVELVLDAGKKQAELRRQRRRYQIINAVSTKRYQYQGHEAGPAAPAFSPSPPVSPSHALVEALRLRCGWIVLQGARR